MAGKQKKYQFKVHLVHGIKTFYEQDKTKLTKRYE